MIEPPIPSDEVERLAALRALHVLDTAPERVFDDIVVVAASLFAAPVAVISLVDADRQWFKASVGIDVAETPRETSFCAHGILNDGTLIVPDASEDPRFHDNPLVTGAEHVRFYVGEPLRLSGGQTIGVLCVIALEARPDPTPAQIAALAALGRLTVDALAWRKATKG